LPWGKRGSVDAPLVTGRLALDLGAQVPGRLVASAKSWLSHAAVDRLAPILPWGADDGGRQGLAGGRQRELSRACSRGLAAPLPESTARAATGDPHRPRLLRRRRARADARSRRQAGLPRLRLLEEPQAAFYDWLFRHQQSLAEELAATRLLLVCDVGGGTTDLTLIQVAIQDGEPVLTRIGVGDHLMLGGDNMDLALAHLVESRLPASEGRLSAPRFSQLTARCRRPRSNCWPPTHRRRCN
jgi:hypothetical protein